jgi:hypothetical protein
MTDPEPVDVPPGPVSAVLCAAWATPADVPEQYRPLLSTELWEVYLMLASEILYRLSGSQYSGGGCTDTATLRSRPPAAGTGSWPYSRTWGECSCWSLGSWGDGRLIPPAPGVWTGTHYSPMAIKLPHGHVTAVTSVTVNGDAFAAWKLDGAGWLERTDGAGWIVCGDVTEIAYAWGVAPPEAGKQAAVRLAIEFALAYNNDSACQLPQRVQTVTRQGISIGVLDPQDFLDKGRTGIYLVDLFLVAANPHSLRRRARVWSPDIPVARRG